MKRVDTRPIMRASGSLEALRPPAVSRSRWKSRRELEGFGTFLLGAVLTIFAGIHGEIDPLAQTVVRSPEHGGMMRWPPHRPRRRLMTFRDELLAEPWRFDLFAVLRRSSARIR